MEEHYDVCIVGTGAAGGILAYRLAKAGLKVISLEQGGSVKPSDFSNLTPLQDKHFGITPKTTFPINIDTISSSDFFATPDIRSESKTSGQYFNNMQILRLNGKTNLWNAICFRFAQKDFADWPISYEDLEKHYSNVEQLIGVTGHVDGLETAPDGVYIPPKPLNPGDRILISTLERIGDGMNLTAVRNRKAIETRPEKSNVCPGCENCGTGCAASSVYKFSNFLLPEIAKKDNYQLITNAKCTKLITDSDGKNITQLNYINTETQESHVIHAKYFVISAGAIETPRILLNSNVANQSGLVGCYLQDSTFVEVVGTLSKLWFNREKYHDGYSDNMIILPKKYLKDDQLPFVSHWHNSIIKIPMYFNTLQRFPTFMRPWIARRFIKSIAGMVMFGPSDPIKSNRLTLSEEKDKYGIPKVDIFFKPTEKEENIKKGMIEVGQKIMKECSGKFITIDERKPGDGIHYAGTCRMGINNEDGVVDKDLQTFNHPNLYLCDGCVFRTLPEKHMTLTIMALADRLAEQLISKF